MFVILLMASHAEGAAEQSEFAMGRAFYADGEFKQAVAHFQQAVKSNPADADSYYWMGMSYQTLADIAFPALRKKPAGSVIHAAFSKATNSVLVAASRWAFSRRYLRFLYPRPRLSRVLIFPLIASTTPSGTFVSQ